MKIKTGIFLTIRVALGAVFVVSGFQKLMSPVQNFVEVIDKFDVIHGAPVLWVAHSLPWIEFVAGVFFVLGFWTRGALVVLWAMNTAFVILLSTTLWRKIPLDSCGCFGEAVKFSVSQMLALDIAIWFLFLIYFLTASRLKVPSLDDAFSPHG